MIFMGQRQSRFFFVHLVWLMVLWAGLVAAAEAHYLSCAEERAIGQAAVRDYEGRYSAYAAPQQIKRIQQRLVENNPGKGLLLSGGARTRYMVPIKVTTDPQVNAFTFPGGHIYVAQQMIDFCNTRDSDGYTDHRNYNRNSLYNNGTLAFVVGHEMGHFVNADYLREYDKNFRWNLLFNIFQMKAKTPEAVFLAGEVQGMVNRLTTRQLSFKVEKQADEKGCDFVEHVPEYSLGNAAIFFRRLGNLEAINNTRQDWQRPHSKTDVRYRRILTRMKKISHGRVQIKDGKFYLDGKLFMGTGLMPAKRQVDALDRTLYVAGQVAAAIDQGCWNERSVMVTENNGWTPGVGAQHLALFAGESRGTQMRVRKVIDVFDLTDKLDVNHLAHHQQEELQAARALMESARKH